MKAIIYENYGAAEQLRPGQVETPQIGANEVLVRVETTSVTTADWRIRAAAFPGIMQLPGRLMFGLLHPKNKVLGVDFSGVVTETGSKVTSFKPGDAVFGFSGKGAYGEYVAVAEDAAILQKPEALSSQEAAALPFGGLSALVFLRDLAKVKPGEKVLVVGASGGVGVYATQIAKYLGAEVTGVSSARNLDLVRSLGADHVIDYQSEDFTANGQRYDVVFDTVGAVGYANVKNSLTSKGRFVPLNFGLREVFQALWLPLLGKKRIVIGVNGDTKEDLETLVGLIETQKLRPVIDRVYAMADIQAAHRYVEGRRRKGAVVVDAEAYFASDESVELARPEGLKDPSMLREVA